MKKYIVLILIMFTGLAICKNVKTENSKFNKKWFTFGAGLSVAFEQGSSAKPFYSLGMSFASKKRIIKLKYNYIYTSGIFTESLSRLYDFGILYGFKSDFEYGNIILSTGISLVSGYYHTSEFVNEVGYVDKKKNIFSVGLPFELQFDWNSFTKFGIGICIFGDINFDKSFFGVGLNFNFGSLRKKPITPK